MYRELLPWAAIAWPAGLRQLVELLPWLVSLSLIGRVSTRALAALSLTETWIYAWMSASWSSVSMTAATLVSQAHGAGRVDAMRGWGAMSMCASAGLAAVVTAAWLASRPALDALGYDAALVQLGQTYVLFALPNLWLEVVNLSSSTYLVSMQRATLPLLLGLASTCVDLVVSYLLIFGAPGLPALPDALQGAALGWTAAGCVSCVCNVAAMRWVWGRELDFRDEDESEEDESEEEGGSTGPETGGMIRPLLPSGGNAGLLQGWGFALLDTEAPLLGGVPTAQLSDGGASKHLSEGGAPVHNKGGGTLVQDGSGKGQVVERPQLGIAAWLRSRTRWRTFLSQLGPNLVTITIATIQYTSISFMAASLGEVPVATHNAMLCCFELLHSLSAGMAEATAVRVGYHLGRGDARSAQTTGVVAVAVAVVWGACVTAAGLAARDQLGRIFTDDPEVLATASSLAPIMFAGYALLCVGDMCMGVLEGAGRATAEAVAFFVSTVGVGLPLAVCSLKLTSLGLRGLWGALLLGYLLLDVFAVILVVYSDWGALVREAKERAADERKQEDEEDAAKLLSQESE